MPLDTSTSTSKSSDTGVEGAAKGVTSTLGNLVGGTSRTAGNIIGAAGRGVGSTVDQTTGTTSVGGGLRAVTDGVESGAASVGKGVEDAGQWKTS